MDGAPLAVARVDYDGDFHAWAMEQAALLRAQRLSEIDLDHIAEEMESLAKRVRRGIESRLEVLLHHLLKWSLQPEHRTRSWRATLLTQRRQLTDRLEDNPSLDARWDEFVETAYPRAMRTAALETGIPKRRFELVRPWTREEILSEDFLPEDEHDDVG